MFIIKKEKSLFINFSMVTFYIDKFDRQVKYIGHMSFMHML